MFGFEYYPWTVYDRTTVRQNEWTHLIPRCPVAVGSAGLESKSVSGNIGIKRHLLTTLRRSASDPSPCLVRESFVHKPEIDRCGVLVTVRVCLARASTARRAVTMTTVIIFSSTKLPKEALKAFVRKLKHRVWIRPCQNNGARA